MEGMNEHTNLYQSLLDFQETVEINLNSDTKFPIHFGAISIFSLLLLLII
jgi:hypothetical protein